MLTVDFDRFPVDPGDRVLDMGCGAGRHAFELYRRGANVVALDMDANELGDVASMFAAMAEQEEVPAGATAVAVRGDAYALPFDDGSFDRIVAAEILEHLPDGSACVEERPAHSPEWSDVCPGHLPTDDTSALLQGARQLAALLDTEAGPLALRAVGE